MQVYPIKDGLVKFVFTHVNDKNWDEEFGFDLYVNDSDYKGILAWYLVESCWPFLPNLDRYVTWLNETKDLYDFLKQMRQAFQLQAKARS